MKHLIILLFFFNSFASFAQSVNTSIATTKISTNTINPKKKLLTVEASCGQCQFKMKGKGCTLAIRIHGKPYFVDKANIDSFGDAHAKMGFCNAISMAKVQGKIVNNKFVATYFKLIEH